MQAFEIASDPLQLQHKKIVIKTPCILREQGVALSGSILAGKGEGHAVTLDFQGVQHFSLTFFDGFFQNAAAEDFKGVNADNISPLGKKLLFLAMGAHYDKVPATKPYYQVYESRTEKLYPVLYGANGIVTVMSESGIAEWLEHNGTVKEIDPEQYEQLMSDYTNAHIEYREKQSAASKPMECPKCHQAYHGSINGYRKHVRNCNKGSR